MKLNAKLRLSFLVIGLVPLAITAVACYQLTLGSWQRRTLGQLEAYAALKEQQLLNLLHHNEEALGLVEGHTQVDESLAAFRADPSATHREELVQSLEDLRQAMPRFLKISVLDQAGTVMASTTAADIGINVAGASWLPETRLDGAAHNLVLDEARHLRFYLTTPLRAEGEWLGVLLIETRGDELLALLRDHRGLGETGTTLLVQRDERGRAVVLAPLRHDPSGATRRLTPARDPAAPPILALQHEEVVLPDYIDDRGVPVFAATRYLPQAQWGIVVKIDRAEVLAPIFALRNVSLWALALTLLVIILMALMVSRSITDPVARLTETATRISAGDLNRRATVGSEDEIGILARSFNGMAESLTDANRGLETKVQERTAALEQSVAEHRAAEESLASERNRLRTLIDNTPDSIFVKDTESRFVIANAAVARLMGAAAPTELLGKTDRDFFPPDLAERYAADEQRVLHSGQPQVAREEPVITPTGEWRWHSTTKVPLRDATGRIIGLVGIGRDITERRCAEEALRSSEEQLYSVIETARDAYIAVNTESQIIDWNSQAEATFGWSHEEVIGKSLIDTIIPVRHAEQHTRGLQHYLKTGEGSALMTRRSELIARHKDGHEFPVEAVFWPVRVGQTQRFNAFLHDISERKQAEQRLQRTAAALEHSNKELELFAYVASHDLQEPLRGVLGCVQILEKHCGEQLDERGRELIQHVVTGSKRMQQLIRDLLQYSRVDTQGRPLEPVDAEAIFQTVLQNLALAITEAGARVSHPPLPTVRGDPTQLMQLFQNLVGNALRYRAQERPPEIELQVERRGADWQFAVRDNGIGIAPKFFEQIFGIFQRLHSRQDYEGTGIGLALCKRIVERHGGRIWVESQPGTGSTFFFTLPAADPSA